MPPTDHDSDAPPAPSRETVAPSPKAALRTLLPFKGSAPRRNTAKPPPSMAGLPFQPPRPQALEGAIPVAVAPQRAPSLVPKGGPVPAKPPSLLDAMNAASAPEDAAAELEPAAKPKTRRAPRATRARAGAPVLRLLWFEPAVVPRMRAEWDELCAEPSPPPGSDELRRADPVRDERSRVERDVIAVVSTARATPASGLVGVVERALGEHGELSPPLVVVAGDLVMSFDPRERVRAMIAAAMPLVMHDAGLSASLAAARTALDDPALEGAEGITKALLAHVRELVAKCKRGPAGVTPAFLDAEVEQVLVAQRKYQKQDVFGRPWLRAELFTGAEEGPALLYLPAALGPILPLAERFSVRGVAEVDLAQDSRERRPVVLRALALARVVARSTLVQ